MREITLEQMLKTKVEKAGGLFLKWTSPGFTGVPDRILLLPGGKIIFVEVKRPGRPDGRTARQKRVHGQLEALGFTVLTVNGKEDLDGYL